RPPGGLRKYPGCRDPRRPRRSAPLFLPGRLYFATESQVWTGGRAFYDPHADGELPCHAYLMTASQFSDVAAQAMYREPDRDRGPPGPGPRDLGPVRWVRAGQALTPASPNAPDLRNDHGWGYSGLRCGRRFRLPWVGGAHCAVH